MQKKRWMGFLILALLAILVFAALASAAPIDTIRAWLSGTGASFKLYSVQFLFFLLVTLILYAITEFIPFLENANPWIRFGVAAIIGILSTFYLAPEEVYTALMGYQSLGIVLTTLVPVIVLLVVTMQWNIRHADYAFFSQILWIAFLAAYMIKYATHLWSWFTTGNTEIGLFGLLFVLITGIVSLIMAIAGGWISLVIFMRRLKGLIVKGKLNTEAEITGKINQLRAYATATPKLAEQYNEMIKQLEKAASKIRQGGS